MYVRLWRINSSIIWLRCFVFVSFVCLSGSVWKHFICAFVLFVLCACLQQLTTAFYYPQQHNSFLSLSVAINIHFWWKIQETTFSFVIFITFNSLFANKTFPSRWCSRLTTTAHTHTIDLSHTSLYTEWSTNHNSHRKGTRRRGNQCCALRRIQQSG